jgi:hypothetical protein
MALKLVDNDDAQTLIECYRLGCLINGKPTVDNDMLDLVVTAEKIRQINILIGLIIHGRLPCYFKDGELTIVTDKAESLNDKNGGTKQ